MNIICHHCLLTMSIVIHLVISPQNAARPSAENREAIKQMVFDWYKRTSPRRNNKNSDYDRDKEKVNPIITPFSEIVNELSNPTDDYGYENDWESGFLPYSSDFVHPKALAIVPAYPMGGRGFRYYPNPPVIRPYPFEGYHPVFRHHHDHSHKHEHLARVYDHYYGHKPIIHPIHIPVPIKHEEHHEKKHIAPWIWPLIIAIVLPVLLGAILLPLSMILILNIMTLVLSISGSNTSAQFIPIAPSSSGRKKRSRNRDHRFERIFSYLAQAERHFEKRNLAS